MYFEMNRVPGGRQSMQSNTQKKRRNGKQTKTTVSNHGQSDRKSTRVNYVYIYICNGVSDIYVCACVQM